jgi:hypothetical protein
MRIAMTIKPESLPGLINQHGKAAKVADVARFEPGASCPICGDTTHYRGDGSLHGIVVELVQYDCGEEWSRADGGAWQLLEPCPGARAVLLLERERHAAIVATMHRFIEEDRASTAAAYRTAMRHVAHHGELRGKSGEATATETCDCPEQGGQRAAIEQSEARA